MTPGAGEWPGGGGAGLQVLLHGQGLPGGLHQLAPGQVGGLTPALTSQAIDSSRRTIIVLSKVPTPHHIC